LIKTAAALGGGERERARLSQHIDTHGSMLAGSLALPTEVDAVHRRSAAAQKGVTDALLVTVAAHQLGGQRSQRRVLRCPASLALHGQHCRWRKGVAPDLLRASEAISVIVLFVNSSVDDAGDVLASRAGLGR